MKGKLNDSFQLYLIEATGRHLISISNEEDTHFESLGPEKKETMPRKRTDWLNTSARLCAYLCSNECL